MKLRVALLAVMHRWQITGYKLGQASGIDRSVIARILRGEVKTAEWERIEKLLSGFEKIDPMAKDAFMGALQRPDSTYPTITDAVLGFSWARDRAESIAEVMAVLGEYKLLDQANIENIKALLAEGISETGAPPCTIEDFLGEEMVRKRREKDGI